MTHAFGRRLVTLSLVLCLLASAVPVAAQEKAKPFLDYRQEVLPNGLRVITLESFSCPIVAVQVIYHVGAKDERADRQGFAHMFEHMMFRGTDRLAATDHFDLIRRAGGWCNGSTGFDKTTYVESLPSNQLELALWLEAERMAYLKVDQTSFDTERKVVEEEARLSLNSPYGGLMQKGLEEIFKVHPYRWPPIGKIAHLRAAAVPELRDFWMRYYAPNNATLLIVGAVKHADAQAMAKKYFGWIPRGEDVPRVTVREPLPTQGRTVTIPVDNAPTPLVALVYRTVSAAHKDCLTVELLATILGDGRSSRLYRSLIADKQLVPFANAMTDSLEQDGLLIVGAALPPIGGDMEKARAALEEQVALLRKEKVTERELLKARNQVMRSQVTGTLSAMGKANMLGYAAVVEGDVERANHVLDDLRAITADDILRAAQTYLAPERCLTVKIEQNLLGRARGLLGTTGKAGDAPATAPQREDNPPPPGRPGAKRPDDFPKQAPFAKQADVKIELDHARRTLPNGMTLLVVPNHQVPFVSVGLHLRNGAWTEAKPGACSMAMSMLTKGTTAHTEAQLAEELETYAIGLGGSGGMDSSAVNASCLTENLDRAMGLMAEVVLQPTFPAKEFETLRKQVRTSLAMGEDNPGQMADRELRRRLFGEHPYSRSDVGLAADVDALTIDDLKQWWSAFARPEDATLIFAGDVTEEQAARLAEKAFGSWKFPTPKTAISLPALPPVAATHIYLVDRPGSIQSEIRIGQLSINRKSPEYFTGRVVDGYFARGFGARLNKTIRVEKGLTYGIGGGLAPMHFGGRYLINTFSKTESTPATVQAVLDEVKRLRAEKPTEEELSLVKSSMLGGFAGSHETPQAVAGDLWTIEYEGLPKDWLQQLLAKAAAVSADDCLAAARQIVDESKLTVVVVGDASKMKAALEAIAPTTVIEPAKRAGATTTTAPAKAAATAPTNP